MKLRLYMDHNVVRAVVEGYRLAGLDVPTAYEDGSHQLSDSELLTRAASLRRVIFTQDTDFLLLAAEWQSRGTPFPLSYLHSMETVRSEKSLMTFV